MQPNDTTLTPVGKLRCSEAAQDAIRAARGEFVRLPKTKLSVLALTISCEVALGALALFGAVGWALAALLLGLFYRGGTAALVTIAPIGAILTDDHEIRKGDAYTNSLQRTPVLAFVARAMSLGWAGVAAQTGHGVIAVAFVVSALWAWAMLAATRVVVAAAWEPKP